MASDLDEARQDLEINGDPQTYRNAYSIYAVLSEQNPHLRRESLQHLYAANQQKLPDGSSLALTMLGTDYVASVSSGSWVTLSISSGGSDGVSLKNVWGFWNSGDGSYVYEDSAATVIALTFEYTLVPINRPWFDISLFAERDWQWTAGDHPLISDGTTNNGGPRGLIPFVAASVVLVRNVQINSDMPISEWTKLQTAIVSGQAVSWGPFVVTGTYVDKSHRPFSPQRQGTSLKINETQILGFLSTVLSRSPNPDPHFDWGNR